ncbi:conserved Plasmodium protein, unknown function [Plasmodium knowlesi strain H]|uniref:Uncharacterized protein n=3 Tax=Plasmodium knowlesi TaxID=5850 RepID=A0A5K1VUW1_PLAKH|nr:conserved protein, unknown function [Plasmodium knowlesi strain H]OTN66789.1 Uncharacterized protein PKNOH_S08501300 [Plasmodium knowlesi]CAA9986718.1 conserved protein, unknown function [Plasmodium knowlesi strain H]SBO23535.1 conserved Plasmodium protein, unknown function [Plasmodium knowlesi strain H]SBO25047.1 conserved Plasmodium protein, unknown function [Plasmodium knowlesi strain H]VVS76192.1 conserved protein, unknown function [Plasmodium knowlesi strain H]|eukprot:XP_002257903.1 hypothetical protein, conserved in Plasmodium species [Plasmodium knowlesi strain H]
MSISNMNVARQFFIFSHKRFLGNIVRGPQPKEIAKNVEYAMDLLHKKSYTYQDFKQKCESLRIFVYFGLVSVLSVDLLINPLKSSYWDRFSPRNMSISFFNFFKNSEDDIFRHNGSASYEQYVQIIR